MGSVCKIIPVKNRLGQLLHKPGGIARSEAVEAAGKNIETLREEYVAAIPEEIEALEAIVESSGRKRISAADLDTMLRRADQLLTLSGTFGFDLLDRVVKRFCDLGMGMIDKKIEDAAPVDVHLRAMRLFCPGCAELTESEAERVLNGLESIHSFYGISRLEQDVNQPAVPLAE